jgi:hypothetical protein
MKKHENAFGGCRGAAAGRSLRVLLLSLAIADDMGASPSPARPDHRSGALDSGVPPDCYLRLTDEGTKLIRGEHKYQRVIPMKP